MIKEKGHSRTDRSFSNLDDAVHFVGSLLRHACVESLQLGDYYFTTPVMALSPNRWAAIFDAIRSAAVRSLDFTCIDFMALDDDAFLVVAGCRSVESLVVRQSIVPSDFVTDDRILGFFFSARASPGRHKLSLTLACCDVTSMFFIKFFERLRSSALQSGSLWLRGAAKQHGLSSYVRYLTREATQWDAAVYHFPSINDDNKSYEVELFECSCGMSVQFCSVYRAS